ncbi:hypothetical protein F4821DRAFT_277226 [Hypoxylon rubiginosum]|uniref:Uncharacterized protein n=1 Tax=Hypoxylon rubiginosum TaxID=110542 RepID=A0ACC0CI69_9PEZI|nr:hypothetical protein F4821DRAFT_277226 [Hypoxylon rubiginosum]
MPGLSRMVATIFKSPTPRSMDGSMESHGTKRKATDDPYTKIKDDGLVQKALSSTLYTRSPIPSKAPSSAKNLSGEITSSRRDRLRGIQKSDVADTTANLARVQGRKTTRLQPQCQSQPEADSKSAESPRVPVAYMGIPGMHPAGVVNPNGPSPEESKPIDESPAKGDVNGQAKAAESQTHGSEEIQSDINQCEEHKVHALLQHHMAQDDSGRVEFLVHWAGEGGDQATWEIEEEIQMGAEELLYAYWKAQGGRRNALFLIPKDAPDEVYHVYGILAHEKKTTGGFELKVQWVGHPPTDDETTMEPEYKLKKIAPEVLCQYWNSVGGRDQFLTRRGRSKKDGTK